MTITSIAWRELLPSDTVGLSVLDAACKRADGDEPVSNLVGDAEVAMNRSPGDTRGAVLPDGQFAAAGWIKHRSGSETTLILGGRVHPHYRRQGLGSTLLKWAEARALEIADGERPITLMIATEGLTADAHTLYTRNRFEQAFAENMMVYDLHGAIPELPLPDGTLTESWTADNAGDFFAVYRTAFQDRPGFPDPPEDDWIADYAEAEGFRPDLSMLARAEGTPVGFVTCERFSHYGWISQIGAAPGWRGRGVATALLARVLHRLRAEGFDEAGLHVNVNNPKAAKVFSQLGFTKRMQRARYVKRVG